MTPYHDYALAAFDGAHFKHIADWQDWQRVERVRAVSQRLVTGRR